MENPRTYGDPPYRAAVIHGGPGAPGSMAPVARELSRAVGILEPLQTTDSLEGQVRELRGQLEKSAFLPVTLIGWSWGAMLSFLVAARHPELVRKLVLVSSAVFESRYAAGILETRLARLNPEERLEALGLMAGMEDPDRRDKNTLITRLGELFTKTDSYSPLPEKDEAPEADYSIYQSVWSEAEALRERGGFLELGARIQCPVTAIHGEYDPHPAAGVKDPLLGILMDFRFILLPKCGHTPWIEREAREKFFRILLDEIG